MNNSQFSDKLTKLQTLIDSALSEVVSLKYNMDFDDKSEGEYIFRLEVELDLANDTLREMINNINKHEK